MTKIIKIIFLLLIVEVALFGLGFLACQSYDVEYKADELRREYYYKRENLN